MKGPRLELDFDDATGKPIGVSIMKPLVLELKSDAEVAVVAMALANLGAMAAGGKGGDRFVERSTKRILSDAIFETINARAALRASTRKGE